MNEFDIIITGGGAAGLIAAKELIKKRKKVLILEANDRIGGRIHSIKPNNFSGQIEAGAEFIHGDSPAIQKLLKGFNISFYPNEGKTYRVKNGQLKEARNFIKDFPILLQKANMLRYDMTFAEFLDKYLIDKKYRELRESVVRFIEGYDAADINQVSTFALREEWKGEGAEHSFRIEGGYGKMIKLLSEEIIKNGCKIKLSTVVKEINWKPGKVNTISYKGEKFFSDKVLVTVPLGILISEPDSINYITFTPELTERKIAMQSIGYGAVIKVILEFKKAFWETDSGFNLRKMPDLGFLLSDSLFTAWWTQLPYKIPLLTGWLTGPNIRKMERYDDNFILENAFDSLSYLFGTDKIFLKNELIARQVYNWQTNPFFCGAYAYAKPGADDAIKKITNPVENTLFFAGEAFYLSGSMGTVEAAIQSGLQASQKILQSN